MRMLFPKRGRDADLSGGQIMSENVETRGAVPWRTAAASLSNHEIKAGAPRGNVHNAWAALMTLAYTSA